MGGGKGPGNERINRPGVTARARSCRGWNSLESRAPGKGQLWKLRARGDRPEQEVTSGTVLVPSGLFACRNREATGSIISWEEPEQSTAQPHPPGHSHLIYMCALHPIGTLRQAPCPIIYCPTQLLKTIFFVQRNNFPALLSQLGLPRLHSYPISAQLCSCPLGLHPKFLTHSYLGRELRQ